MSTWNPSLKSGEQQVKGKTRKYLPCILPELGPEDKQVILAKALQVQEDFLVDIFVSLLSERDRLKEAFRPFLDAVVHLTKRESIVIKEARNIPQ